MQERKREQLTNTGHQVGSAADFLGLTAEEEALVELKLALSAGLRRRRQEQQLTQASLARRLHSSQTRIAKLEAGDPSASLDILIQALLATGVTRTELGVMIADTTAAYPG